MTVMMEDKGTSDNVRALSVYLAGVILVWALGAFVGLLIPRPKWVAQWGFLYASPTGLMLRKLILVGQFSLVVREIWYYLTPPTTFRRLLRAAYSGLTGKGWKLEEPQHLRGRHSRQKGSPLALADSEGVSWYVTEEDLKFCQTRMEQNAQPPGFGDWEEMMMKDFGTFTYQAWRRSMPNGKTEYKSVTVADDATAEEFLDFYLDDPTRPKWDSMISEYDVLESGDAAHRCQVVRWVRTFPFSFLSKREYVIGRRAWKTPDNCLYGITKGVEHPRAPALRGIVRMEAFYSMWRSRTIPCLKGNGKPACETVLLHMEEFKINENLARFAVRHGMSGFVSKLGPAVADFVAERRKRVGPFETDPDAYGARDPPNPPPSRSSSVSSASSASLTSARTDGRFGSRPVSRAASFALMPAPGGMVRASSVRLLSAAAMARSASTRSLGPHSPSKGMRGSASTRSLAGERGCDPAAAPQEGFLPGGMPQGQPDRGRRKRLALCLGAVAVALAVGGVGLVLNNGREVSRRPRSAAGQQAKPPLKALRSHRIAEIAADSDCDE